MRLMHGMSGPSSDVPPKAIYLRHMGGARLFLLHASRLRFKISQRPLTNANFNPKFSCKPNFNATFA